MQTIVWKKPGYNQIGYYGSSFFKIKGVILKVKIFIQILQSFRYYSKTALLPKNVGKVFLIHRLMQITNFAYIFILQVF
jgi:hypothetical protein